MDYIQLIYNPMAGSRTFRSRLDHVLEVFGEKGYEVRIHRTSKPEDFYDLFTMKDLSDAKAILVAGGDGSVNMTINAMIQHGIDCPIGVIPAGTANDFARHLGIPDNFAEAVMALAEMQVKELDIGEVNTLHFANVCSGGLLVDISQHIDIELKNRYGKLAYYMKGIQELANFKKIPFRIRYDEKVIEEDLFLFLVLNGSSAGGFNKLGANASMQDGMFDFIGIRAFKVNELPVLFTKIMTGDHLYDKNILYFQSDNIQIESLATEEIPSDVDGEVGPSYPLHIKMHHNRMKFIINPKCQEENQEEEK